MKKGTTTILLLAAAGAAAFFLLRKRGAQADTARTAPEDMETDTETPAAETPDATVKAPAGQFFEALDKAKEVASTIKDAVVTVKSGTKKAVVRTGTKRKKPKWTAKQLADYCNSWGYKSKGTRKEKKEYRQCVRKAKRKQSLPMFVPTETIKQGA